MTATKLLCARLDELGVEYDTYDLPNGEHGVSWIDGNNIEWEAVQRGENFEIHALQLVAPEQAIAATVGVGTCKLVIEKRPHHGPWIYHFGCGYDFWQPAGCPMPVLKHCPNCGKRIAKEEAE